MYIKHKYLSMEVKRWRCLSQKINDDRKENKTMIYPDFDTVRIYAQEYTYIPVYKRIPYDGKSVLDIYSAIRGDYAFLLESGDQTYQGRYSIIALPCTQRFLSDGTTSSHIQGEHVQTYHENPMTLLEDTMKERSPLYPEIPVFTGGAIGHFNYDIARLYENIPDTGNASLHLPLLHFGFVKEVFVIDHKMKEVYIIVNIDCTNLEENYAQAITRLTIMEQLYEEVTPCQLQPTQSTSSITSSSSRVEFEDMVRKGKEYIHNGDIFQVVLSQRLESDYYDDPLCAYAKLRENSISPYMYYLDFKDYVIAGASPELLLQSRGNYIRTMPIAGTRKRGKTNHEDELLMQELMKDKKENAEHMMLVDLGRNDIGKVSKIGSVQVLNLKHIQKYSHVMHMTSEVTGILRDDKTIFDALGSLLPAGTLSGAPKIRAMEIIEELEHVKREIYGGAIGFIGYNQQFDTCITIRSFIFHNRKVYMQAGAGIVKDSIPEKEYKETLQKAAVLLSAIGHEVYL